MAGERAGASTRDGESCRDMSLKLHYGERSAIGAQESVQGWGQKRVVPSFPAYAGKRPKFEAFGGDAGETYDPGGPGQVSHRSPSGGAAGDRSIHIVEKEETVWNLTI